MKKLELLRKKYRDLNGEIDSILGLLKEFETKHVKTIAPSIVSKRLDKSYIETIFLLGLAEKVDILKKSYQVYTVDSNFFLGEFNDSNEIPRILHNPATGSDVTRDDYVVDLVYHFA